jgi:hypothetical protein
MRTELDRRVDGQISCRLGRGRSGKDLGWAGLGGGNGSGSF